MRQEESKILREKGRSKGRALDGRAREAAEGGEETSCVGGGQGSPLGRSPPQEGRWLSQTGIQHHRPQPGGQAEQSFTPQKGRLLPATSDSSRSTGGKALQARRELSLACAWSDAQLWKENEKERKGMCEREGERKLVCYLRCFNQFLYNQPSLRMGADGNAL